MSIQSIVTSALPFSFLLLLSFAFPVVASATVTINEVMYNPNGTDAGREWIELYNDGSEDIKLVGGSGKGSWRIVDSSNHTIVDPQGGVGRGSLVVPAWGYLILASDPTVFMGEYSGSYSVAKTSLSLANTGSTVSLVDGAGAVVDSFTYTASQGGNDNTTSLQKSGGAWLQALPTPGATNANEAYTPPAQESSSSNSSSSGSSSKTFGYVSPPVPGIFADAGEDRTVIVGAATKFVATAYDRDRDVVTYAKFSWNFGDGTTAQGPEVMHHFSYPGRYMVDLIITNTEVQSRSHVVITAEPASVSLGLLPQGGVSIKNNSSHDLDFSFWQVKEGEHVFTLPERSVALKSGAINISAVTLGFTAIDAKLYYPDGTEVVSSEPGYVAVAPAAQPVVLATPAAAVFEAPLLKPVIHVEEPAMQALEASPAPEMSQESLQPELAASAATSEASLPLWTALAGLGGIMGLGVASVWAVRRKPVTATAGEEFTIE